MYDVVICGGGSAGVAAAIRSARDGSKVMLIESGGCLGGIWTQSCVGYLMDRKEKNGILEEITWKLGLHENQKDDVLFDVEKMKYILEDMCIDAGVELLYHARVCGATVRNGLLTEVIIASKNGIQHISSSIFIDCTGDGDLAYFAGCQYQEGNQDGFLQPMSFECVITGLNYEEVKSFVFNNPESTTEQGKRNFLAELKEVGVVPSYVKPTLGYVRKGMFILAVNHEYNVHGTNASETTQATLHARKEVNDLVEALRKKGGVWKDILLVQSPACIGVREGRRIKGLYTVSIEDLKEGTHYFDSVCRVTGKIDIHNAEGYADGNFQTKPYDIPLRALISADYPNLMMAGRCISGDFYAHASYRLSGNTVRMGESAGAAAAYTIKRNVLPHMVDAGFFKSI